MIPRVLIITAKIPGEKVEIQSRHLSDFRIFPPISERCAKARVAFPRREKSFSEPSRQARILRAPFQFLRRRAVRNTLTAALLRCSGVAHSRGKFVALVILVSSSM